jgi:hypothetical protein
MIDLFLIFAMALDADALLNRGRLMLFDRQRGPIGRWVATSGLGSYQDVRDWNHVGGGVLPATYQLRAPIPWYQVVIEPIDLSYLKGVEGNAYQIIPTSQVTDGGVTRSDELIHRDANVPGTLGCIGIQGTAEFADFERVFRAETDKLRGDIKTIDLSVIYTY